MGAAIKAMKATRGLPASKNPAIKTTTKFLKKKMKKRLESLEVMKKKIESLEALMEMEMSYSSCLGDRVWDHGERLCNQETWLGDLAAETKDLKREVQSQILFGEPMNL